MVETYECSRCGLWVMSGRDLIGEPHLRLADPSFLLFLTEPQKGKFRDGKLQVASPCGRFTKVR
jgi:hypothetical protein